MDVLADVMREGLASFEVPRNSIVLDLEIGQGEFGVVMHALATRLPDGLELTSVAVKVMKQGLAQSDSTQFIREGLRLKALSHINVVKLLACCLASEPYMLVLEYMVNGDLKALLRRCKESHIGLSVSHLLKFAVDAGSGFAYLQEMRFVHRDIAARNVLVDSLFTAKIGDFGLP